MDRPRMRQSMFSQQDEASIQQPRLERQRLRHPSVIGPPPRIEPDFDPNAYRLFDQPAPTPVNRAYRDFHGEGTAGHYDIFVGNLGDEVTEVMLFRCFSGYRHFLGARIVRDQITCCSKGFGFVTFTNQQDAESAINDLNGKLLGSRRMRCNWPTGAGDHEDKHGKSVVGSTEDGKEMPSRAPEDDPRCTSVYVGNLSPEVTQQDLFLHFQALGAGEIDNVKIRRDEGYGFVRYSTHSEAALAIQMGKYSPFLSGRLIKCSWGWKPYQTGTTRNCIPLSAAASSSDPSFSGSGLLAYDRSLQTSQMGGANSIVQPPIPLPPAYNRQLLTSQMGEANSIMQPFRLPTAASSSDPRLSGSDLLACDLPLQTSQMGGANSLTQPPIPLPPAYNRQLLTSQMGEANSTMQPFLRLGSIPLPVAASYSDQRLSGSDLPVDDRQLLTSQMGSADSMQPIPLPAAVSSSDSSLSDSGLLADDRQLLSSQMSGANSILQPIPLPASSSDPSLSCSDLLADNRQPLPSQMGGANSLMQPREQRTEEQAALEHRTQEQADTEQQTAMEQQRTQDQAALELRRTHEQADMDQRHTQERAAMEQQRTQDQAALDEQRTQDQAALDQHTQEHAAMEGNLTQEHAAMEQQHAQEHAAMGQQLTHEQADMDQRNREQAAMEQQRTQGQGAVDQSTQDQAAMELQRTQDQAALDRQRTQEHASMEQQRAQEHAAMEQPRDEEQAATFTQRRSVEFPPLTGRNTKPSLRLLRSLTRPTPS